MTGEPLDATNWRLLIDARTAHPLPAARLEPARPLAAPLPRGVLTDAGGLVTLLDAAGLKVEGVAYLAGDSSAGWSTSFA